VPLERRGRPPADPQQSSLERQPANEQPEEEAADDGLDWLREHLEARQAGAVGENQPLPPLAAQPGPGRTSQLGPGEPPAQPGFGEPGFDQTLGVEPEFDQTLGVEPEFDQTDQPPPAEPVEPEPSGESPAVRRLREAAAESDESYGLTDPNAMAQPDPAAVVQPDAMAQPDPGAMAQPDAVRPAGRSTPIRPAPAPPPIRPAESLQPPGAVLSEIWGGPLDPPASAEPPPLAEAAGDQAPAASRPPLPPTPAELAEQRAAGDRSGAEAPLPGWDDLTPEKLVKRQPGGPTSGWQGFVYRLTNGRIRPRPGRAERARRELAARIATPITGCRRVAVFTLKGGVGKTTTTVGLGNTFATHRADRVVAVDGSPDAGTLGARVRGGEGRSPRDLIAGASSLARYADVRANITQTPTGLEVVASTMDPSISEGFNENDYRKIAAILERFYSLILTDCGPGALHSVIWPVLRQADQLLIVCAPSVDGARSASLTLDWLEQHNFDKLARSAVVVLNAVRPKAAVNLAQLEEHFTRRCRAVVQVPFDRHLETGAEIDLGELAPETRDAYLRLAAAVADGFGATTRAGDAAQAGAGRP
jgi:MinD-like ATPase involved in chromosome partitioning or flagellar assembly